MCATAPPTGRHREKLSASSLTPNRVPSLHFVTWVDPSHPGIQARRVLAGFLRQSSAPGHCFSCQTVADTIPSRPIPPSCCQTTNTTCCLCAARCPVLRRPSPQPRVPPHPHPPSWRTPCFSRSGFARPGWAGLRGSVCWVIVSGVPAKAPTNPNPPAGARGRAQGRLGHPEGAPCGPSGAAGVRKRGKRWCMRRGANAPRRLR
jgi:hypothetical protein